MKLIPTHCQHIDGKLLLLDLDVMYLYSLFSHIKMRTGLKK